MEKKRSSAPYLISLITSGISLLAGLIVYFSFISSSTESVDNVLAISCLIFGVGGSIIGIIGTSVGFSQRKFGGIVQLIAAGFLTIALLVCCIKTNSVKNIYYILPWYVIPAITLYFSGTWALLPMNKEEK